MNQQMKNIHHNVRSLQMFIECRIFPTTDVDSVVGAPLQSLKRVARLENEAVVVSRLTEAYIHDEC